MPRSGEPSEPRVTDRPSRSRRLALAARGQIGPEPRPATTMC